MPPVPKTSTAAAKKAVKKVAPKESQTSGNGRTILYDDVVCRVARREQALTEDQAKKLLGWYEVGSDEEAMLTDLEGKRIQCSNNTWNRPFTLANALAVCQSHLKKRWKLNGETLIIGKTGLTISAQHRLVGLILACQKYRADPSKYPELSSPPTMETLIAFGIDEDDDTVNTIDTGKSRSIAEIVFRSECFADLPKQARKECSRLTEYAIRFVWDRLGIAEAFSVIKTPAESIAFLGTHPKILECVRHVFEENGGKEGRLSKFLTPGYCSGLFFLMACSTSDSSKYRSATTPTQELLEWDNFEKAESFITLLASGNKDMEAVRKAVAALYGDSAAGGTKEEKTAILVKAWNRYVEGKPITEASLRLEYDTNGDGVKSLIEHPTVGGVDLGSEEDAADAKDAVAEGVANDPDTGKSAGETHLLKGDKVWVNEKEPGTHWWAYLDQVYADPRTKAKMAKVRVPKGFAGAGKILTVPYDSICDNEPTPA